jgi:hypothetical protein
VQDHRDGWDILFPFFFQVHHGAQC